MSSSSQIVKGECPDSRLARVVRGMPVAVLILVCVSLVSFTATRTLVATRQE
jgi:hypothetical protein